VLKLGFGQMEKRKKELCENDDKGKIAFNERKILPFYIQLSIWSIAFNFFFAFKGFDLRADVDCRMQ